ncbi:MAG: type I-E CRISPR-associated protein Cse2/CasB [Dehalococcoidales bacterium]|nr:type I-E CRISPR-associated protein Cse2/CasB [Dehalococcoidales bacterium]
MTLIVKTREQEFIARIERLGTDELAKLRRGCGERDPVEGRCPWLIGLVYGVASEATSFLVASLLAQYKTSHIRAGNHRGEGNFGITWKQAVLGTDSKSLFRRFNILLEAEYDPWTGEGDLPYRLRQMVRYAAGKDIGIDWSVLLTDLKFWNHSEKRVQKRWARSFFSSEVQDNKNNELSKE